VEPGETDRPARGSVDATGHRGGPTQTKVLHIRGLVVTWLLRHRAAGCICRLQVDEAETSGMVELEDVWLPILAELQRCLGAVPNQMSSSEKPGAIF
jgi:hypothetical protein